MLTLSLKLGPHLVLATTRANGDYIRAPKYSNRTTGTGWGSEPTFNRYEMFRYPSLSLRFRVSGCAR